MNHLDSNHALEFDRLLAAREEEVCAILRARDSREKAVANGGVTDFKDLAGDEAAAAVDEAQAEHAAHELEDILAARRRLADGTYGLCRACGEPIGLERLRTLPATSYCVGCQFLHEQHDSRHRLS